MVSFQCEACGDVFTKKKLDPHRNQCRGASFACLDCMTHFRGTEYRSHTSCMTEAQKYQGSTYKEKPPKSQRPKSVTIAPSSHNNNIEDNHNHNTNSNDRSSLVPRAPYVEDAPDPDDQNRNGAPPPAPSPPPASESRPSTTVATTDAPVNVFDFLVTENTPNASKVSVGGTREQMQMVDHAPSVFEPSTALTKLDRNADEDVDIYDVAYEENGFSYGAGPIQPGPYPQGTSNPSMVFVTPAPKKKDRRVRREEARSPELTRNGSSMTSDKKRKRGNPRDLDMELATSAPWHYEEDTPMTDAPSSIINNPGTPALNHSGLTGGLSRMMGRDISPTPEYSDYGDDDDHLDNRKYKEPVSPIKRSRRNNKEANRDSGLGISIKGHAGRIISLIGNSGTSNEPPSKALVRTRRRSSSEADGSPAPAQSRRPKKHHRTRRSSGENAESTQPRKSKRKSSHTHANGETARDDYGVARPRRMKAIEYRRNSDSDRSRSRSPRNDRALTTTKDVEGNEENQLVVYRQSGTKPSPSELQREKATHFLSLVTKGPDSERGCSIHKALKRLHRDYPSSVGSEERDVERERERGRGRRRRGGADRERRSEEEKELWRTLRLKKNERGEVVLFF
ncbi:hypothetical protein FQN54_006499 [Arachnomyces sp. PD_36]|nr:hypothetical protein FQN54_006499 [Arachnomyces sp. PD_36]